MALFHLGFEQRTRPTLEYGSLFHNGKISSSSLVITDSFNAFVFPVEKLD